MSDEMEIRAELEEIYPHDDSSSQQRWSTGMSDVLARKDTPEASDYIRYEQLLAAEATIKKFYDNKRMQCKLSWLI